MKQLLEFIPLVLFFITYKIYGVQVSAIVLAIASILQAIALKVLYKKLTQAQKFTLIFVVFFALLTAYFNDLEFLKWKVTIINLLFAAALLISQFGYQKPLLKLIMGGKDKLTLSDSVWQKLNLGWAVFFISCAGVNEVIRRLFSNDIWVDFKSFGLLGLSLLASIATAIYIYPHTKNQSQ